MIDLPAKMTHYPDTLPQTSFIKPPFKYELVDAGALLKTSDFSSKMANRFTAACIRVWNFVKSNNLLAAFFYISYLTIACIWLFSTINLRSDFLADTSFATSLWWNVPIVLAMIMISFVIRLLQGGPLNDFDFTNWIVCLYVGLLLDAAWSNIQAVTLSHHSQLVRSPHLDHFLIQSLILFSLRQAFESNQQASSSDSSGLFLLPPPAARPVHIFMFRTSSM